MARLSLIISACLFPLLVHGGVSSELKFQQSWIVEDNSNPVAKDYAVSVGSLRLSYQDSKGPFSWSGHYVLGGVYSDEWAAITASTTVSSADPLWDFSDTIHQGKQREVDHRLDRLWLMYGTDSWVLKLGRQAITWGSGRVFRPMDLFNPFSSTTKDMSHKPGSDMAYLQYLFDSGADFQLLHVPRRDPDTHDISSSLSYTAAKWLWFSDTNQIELLLAEDYRDTLLGLALAVPVDGALFSVNVVPTWVEGEHFRWSAVANLEYSWGINGHPVTGYLEYYRNGYGHTDVESLDNQNPILRDKQQRGQVFNSGRHYLAAGMSVQLTALTTVQPTVIYNINDQSSLLLLTLDYSFSQDTRLVFGGFLPIGSDGTEYGGLKTTKNHTILVRPSPEIYLRFEWFY